MCFPVCVETQSRPCSQDGLSAGDLNQAELPNRCSGWTHRATGEDLCSDAIASMATG